MKNLRGAALCGALSLALAGCSTIESWTTDIGTAETRIAQDLPSACAAIASADAIFQAIVATQASVGQPLAASAVKNESTAMAGVAAICASPSAVSSTPAVIATALSAYSAVTQSIAAAKAKQ